MLSLAFSGCGDDDGADPDAGMDAGTDAGEMDAGEMDAGEMDAGEMDAGEMDAGEMDAGETDAGEMGSCGWNAGTTSYECFASDDPPDTVVCDGDECCSPNDCSPELAQTCCNMVTGQLRVIFYTGGTCEEMTQACVD